MKKKQKHVHRSVKKSNHTVLEYTALTIGFFFFIFLIVTQNMLFFYVYTKNFQAALLYISPAHIQVHEDIYMYYSPCYLTYWQFCVYHIMY